MMAEFIFCWSIPIQFHNDLVIERICNLLFSLQLYFYLFHRHKWELTDEWIHVEDTVPCGCMNHCAKQRQVRQIIHFIQGQTDRLSVCKQSVFGFSSRRSADKNTELSLHARAHTGPSSLYRSAQQRPTLPDLKLRLLKPVVNAWKSMWENFTSANLWRIHSDLVAAPDRVN